VEATKVGGGGRDYSPAAALLLLRPKSIRQPKGLNDEEAVGVKILRLALEQPTRLIARNSGEDDGYVVAKIKVSVNGHAEEVLKEYKRIIEEDQALNDNNPCEKGL